jgi:hypothetical protein
MTPKYAKKKHPPQKPHISPPYLPQIDAQRHPQYFELIYLEEDKGRQVV